MGRRKKESADGLTLAPTNSEREKLIVSILESTEKNFGPEAMMTLGGRFSRRHAVGVVSTGSYGLDLALGIGGLPRGRIVELYGPEMSGKTTLGLHTIAQAQAVGDVCAYIDAEHAIDPAYATALGVNIDELLISQPTSGEEALNIAKALIEGGNVGIIVVDSVAALVPRAELEGDIGDSVPGGQARMMSQTLRMLTASIYRSNTILIFINQLRYKIGVPAFASPETTSGGNALKFYASIRLDVRRIGALKKNDDKYGNRTRVTVSKNKLAPPFKSVEFDIVYGKGVDRMGEIVDIGVERKVISRAGSWYSYKGEQIGQGRVPTIFYLENHPEVAEQIMTELKNGET